MTLRLRTSFKVFRLICKQNVANAGLLQCFQGLWHLATLQQSTFAKPTNPTFNDFNWSFDKLRLHVE